MRLPILIMLGSIASVVAGALIILAFSQTSLVMTSSLAAGGVLTFLVATLCSWVMVQGSFDSVVKQVRDSNRDSFDSTSIYEFNQLARKIADTRREGVAQIRRSELDLAEAVSKARDEVRIEYEAAPSVTEQFLAIQGYLAGMDGHSSLGSDGQPLTCLEQIKRVFRRFQADVGSDMSQVLGCGQEIFRTTEELVIGTEAQSEAFEKTNTLAEQLSDRVGAICDYATRTQDSCTATSNAAAKSLTQVATLVDEVQELKNQSSLRERKLESLGQHTREVENILQTIGTLSSRTDLLALNASIESVRAGEHGRGFALVAEEVRALAEQSAQAVADITTRLEMIQLETAHALNMTGGEQTQLGNVIERVANSLEVLEDICKASAESTNGLCEITQSTNEQLKLTNDIVETLQRTAETARINRSRAQGANWKAKSFEDLSVKIGSTLLRFGDDSANSGQQG